MAKLRLLPVGDLCCPDPHGSESTPQRRRIVGRRHEEVEKGKWAWVPTGKPDELDYHHDLAKAVRDGDLAPFDAETAKACGVEWNASQTKSTEPTRHSDGGEDTDQ